MTTAQKILDAGFGLGVAVPEDGVCGCGHLFGPHQFEASFGSPLDGGLYYCQDHPTCPCTGTWGTNCPEELRDQYRDRPAPEAES
jgi:hypothetical protein